MSNFSSCLYVFVMRKSIFTIVLVLFLTIILSGCNENEWFKYEFEDFHGVFNTEKSFELYKGQLNWLWYNLLKNSVIKIYSESNPESFTESIIISKKNSDKDVESFAKENIDNVDISWLKFSKWKTIDLKCNWTTLKFVYYQWKYNLNQYTIYLTDWFLKVNKDIYIISYSSLDEKSRNKFSSSFSTITCN